jgi:hypothetical protein
MLVGAPQPRLNLFNFIPQPIPALSALIYPIPHSIPSFPCSLARDGSSSIPTGTLIIHSTLFTHPILALLCWDKLCSIPSGTPLRGLAVPYFISHFLTAPASFGSPQFHSAFVSCSSFGTTQLRFDSLLFHSTLLQHLLCCSSFSHNTPHLALLISPGSCSHFSSGCIILRHISPFRFLATEHFITLLFDITNRAKRHWNSILSDSQDRMFRK